MELQELKTYLTPELAEQVALDIVELLETKATDDNLDVDFRLSQGRMVESLDGPNTWFQCDCTPGTKLEAVKTVIGQVFSKDFDEKDKIQMKTAEELVQVIEEFLDNIRMVLNSGIYHERVANTIRAVSLGGVPSTLVPMDVLRFLDVEIGEVDKNEFVVAIQKLPRVDSVSGQFIEPPQSVNADLFETQKLTGKDFEEIVAMRKAENDPRYAAVAGVTKRRYSFELHLRIAADYSFCDLPSAVAPENES